MVDDVGDGGRWYPGSFTKNFSWGPPANGLKRLHETIEVGFAGELRPAARSTFRQRMSGTGLPQYIPVNFFLFNKSIKGRDYIAVDELVFQALYSRPGERFDRLAQFAFIFSRVGIWKGATQGQRRPALWAFHYVRQRVSRELNWKTKGVSADDIESFISTSGLYTGQTTRKLATNLNYLFQIGGLKSIRPEALDRWWVDAVFLALDRIIEDNLIDGRIIPESRYEEFLIRSSFLEVTGRDTIEKRLALSKLVRLYIECGGPGRFSEEVVRARQALRISEVAAYLANDDSPRAAVHPSNPKILKMIPQACAMLAVYAGFEVIHFDDLEEFDAKAFVRTHTVKAIEDLKARGIHPTMSAEDLLRLTRGR